MNRVCLGVDAWSHVQGEICKNVCNGLRTGVFFRYFVEYKESYYSFHSRCALYFIFVIVRCLVATLTAFSSTLSPFLLRTSSTILLARFTPS